MRVFLTSLLNMVQDYGYPALWVSVFIAAVGLPLPIALVLLAACAGVFIFSAASKQNSSMTASSYLGFDRNEYPGDEALAILRKTFSFSSYWLSAPPGGKQNSWRGKRGLLEKNDFGLLVLFNARETRSIKNTANGAAAGDLYVLVRVREDERFVREGDDLITLLDVPAPLAALGGTFQVPTLNGALPVEVASGTQPGEVITLRGQGMPRLERHGSGDLRVVVNVQIPRRLSDEQRALLERFSATITDENLRAEESMFARLRRTLRSHGL